MSLKQSLKENFLSSLGAKVQIKKREKVLFSFILRDLLDFNVFFPQKALQGIKKEKTKNWYI